jgi:hypothetical protein
MAEAGELARALLLQVEEEIFPAATQVDEFCAGQLRGKLSGAGG